jgi:stage II sporulation protein M
MMMLGIFFNNATASVLAMISGLAAGLVPLVFVISNGMIIGIILEMIITKAGVAEGITLFLVGILPHGIFELPAVLISTAIGIKMGYKVIMSLLSRKDLFTEDLKNGMLIFIFWILPILLIAAVIETYVTGALLAHFVHSPIF